MNLTVKECDYIINALPSEYSQNIYESIMSKVEEHRDNRLYKFISDYGYTQWINSGWYHIITKCFDKIDGLCRFIYFDITNIKSKYGGLSIDYVGGNEEIEQLIFELEEVSFRTCEYCGNEGTQTKDEGRIRTLCDECKLLHNKH